jgi:hypothetical protein
MVRYEAGKLQAGTIEKQLYLCFFKKKKKKKEGEIIKAFDYYDKQGKLGAKEKQGESVKAVYHVKKNKVSPQSLPDTRSTTTKSAKLLLCSLRETPHKNILSIPRSSHSPFEVLIQWCK